VAQTAKPSYLKALLMYQDQIAHGAQRMTIHLYHVVYFIHEILSDKATRNWRHSKLFEKKQPQIIDFAVEKKKKVNCRMKIKK